MVASAPVIEQVLGSAIFTEFLFGFEAGLALDRQVCY